MANDDSEHGRVGDGSDRPASERLEDLLARAQHAAAEARDRLAAHEPASMTVLRETAHASAEASREAWRAYHEKVEEIAIEAELALVEARCELDLELAGSQAEVRAAAGAVVDDWRGRIDELRVRAEVGRMDLEDQLAPILAAIEDRYRRARGLVRAARS